MRKSCKKNLSLSIDPGFLSIFPLTLSHPWKWKCASQPIALCKFCTSSEWHCTCTEENQIFFVSLCGKERYYAIKPKTVMKNIFYVLSLCMWLLCVTFREPAKMMSMCRGKKSAGERKSRINTIQKHDRRNKNKIRHFVQSIAITKINKNNIYSHLSRAEWNYRFLRLIFNYRRCCQKKCTRASFSKIIFIFSKKALEKWLVESWLNMIHTLPCVHTTTSCG